MILKKKPLKMPLQELIIFSHQDKSKQFAEALSTQAKKKVPKKANNNDSIRE